MFTEYCRSTLRAFVALGMVFAVNPATLAGGAQIIMPAQDSDVPQGSFIPERRLQAIEQRVIELKATMAGRDPEQRQERPTEDQPSMSH